MKNILKGKAIESWLTNFFSKNNSKQQAVIDNKNIFLERTIENWLGCVNELTYQFSFYQILLSEGYEIIYNSKHNAFEQGKDVVARKKGKYFAFQLKGGDITNGKWRNEVKAECEELVEYPIVNPAVKKGSKHQSILVTNGEIEDTVRLAITSLNSQKWKDAPLETVTKGQLLSRLIKISNDFTPKSPTDYRDFLDLYLTDGRGLVDIPKYEKFIKAILQIDNEDVFREERRRNVATAAIYSGYIISSFETHNNYISIIQALTVLSSYILALAEKYKLKEKFWFGSFVVIQDKIKESSRLLEVEIGKGGFNEMINSIFDGEIGPYRKNLAVSYLFAYKIRQILESDEDWSSVLSADYFKTIEQSLFPWSESGLYPYVLLFFLLNKFKNDENSYTILENALKLLVDENGKNGNKGLFSPYYKIDDVIKNNFGLMEEPIDESFIGNSYYIKPIISLIVRHGKKELIKKYWRGITYIAQLLFKPDEIWQNYLWLNSKGENVSVFPKQTKSWSELVSEEQKIDYDTIPKLLRKYYFFLPHYLLVFPHRLNSENVKYIDDKIFKK